MTNHVQTKTALQATTPTALTHAELQSVSGGLNPQPLPPRVAYSFVNPTVFTSMFRAMPVIGY